MASDLRATLKRVLPTPARRVLSRVRKLITPPPIDDVVLTDHPVTRDGDATPRITIVLPRLEKGSDFGGFATGIDIWARLSLALKAAGPIDVRVIITDVIADTDPSIVISRAAKAGLVIGSDQITMATHADMPIAVRRNEMFVTYNWWTTLNFAKVRDAQAAMFGEAPKPLIWLMQDYEPAFYAFSSAHLLARAAYDTCAPLWGIINTTNLADYLERSGHSFARSFVFEPVISDALRPYLDRIATSTRRKRVLVYGRPFVERNCFPALVRGLRRWVQDYPQYADWEVISAGTAHEPVDLGGGRKLVSVGKLSLDEYAEVLLTSSAGVSLMASPHPSYPPLEMAHFGVRTVTNGFVCKDLSTFHPGITSLMSIEERPLADALAAACASASEAVHPYANREYLRTELYPFLGELVTAVAQHLTDDALKGEDFAATPP